jgi:hypothetical protein
MAFISVSTAEGGGGADASARISSMCVYFFVVLCDVIIHLTPGNLSPHQQSQGLLIAAAAA